MLHSSDPSIRERYGGLAPGQILQSLWLILAGNIIYSIPYGFSLELHNPTTGPLRITPGPLGAVLIAVGVFMLARLEMELDYKRQIYVVLGIAVLRIAAALASYATKIGTDRTTIVAFVFFDFASLWAQMEICRCVRWFCQDTALKRSANDWLKTTAFHGCYLAAMGLFDVVILITLAVVRHLHAPAGVNAQPMSTTAWYVLILPFAVAAWISFYRSVINTRDEIIIVETAEPWVNLTAPPRTQAQINPAGAVEV
jgi:hypothetical protein